MEEFFHSDLFWGKILQFFAAKNAKLHRHQLPANVISTKT